jgi:hypothetical protein
MPELFSIDTLPESRFRQDHPWWECESEDCDVPIVRGTLCQGCFGEMLIRCDRCGALLNDGLNADVPEKPLCDQCGSDDDDE